MTYFDMGLREQVCEIGRNLWNRAMVAANDANTSVMVSPGKVLCTPTGVSKGYLTPAMLPVVDLLGNVVDQHEGYRPSSEIKMHLRFYRASPEVGAVVHAHPRYSTVFAVKGATVATKMLPECVVEPALRFPIVAGARASPVQARMAQGGEGPVTGQTAVLIDREFSTLSPRKVSWSAPTDLHPTSSPVEVVESHAV
jgi:ribulose-5-phosphate 4-epimerase/fuculose-1-phosphate aldolase